MACLILYPLGALSVIGNVALFGGKGGVVWGVMLAACIGLELALLLLIGIAARSKSVFTLSLAILLMFVSVKGQYAEMLTNAHSHETDIGHAKVAQADNSGAINAARAELATLSSALDDERKSKWGPKCDALAKRIDGVKADIARLEQSTVAARTVEAKASPLLVMCERFGLPEALTLNIDAALVLLVLNAAGFTLLYFANNSKPATAEVKAEVKAPVKRKARARAKKDIPLALPANVIRFPKRQTSLYDPAG